MADGGIHNLDVYKRAHELAVRIHAMTLALPAFERYEEGSQIRRSSKRVAASLVEGFAVRKYKNLYLSYLYRALGSADETREHLKILHETDSLRDAALFESLERSSAELSRMLAKFVMAVERQHRTPAYLVDVEGPPLEPDEEAALILRKPHPKSDIRNLESEVKEPPNGKRR